MTSRTVTIKSKKPINPVPTTTEEWFTQKVKTPKSLTMTLDGNLSTTADHKATGIDYEPKVPASIEYIQGQLKLRNEQRIEKEGEYTITKRNLVEVMKEYKAGLRTIDDVIKANQEVHIAECNLNGNTKEPRYIEKIEGITGKELYVDSPYDTSKIAESVITAKYSTLPYTFFWMDKPQERIPVEDEEQEEQPQEGQQKGGREKTSEEKARIWAIIRAKKAKAALFK